MADEDERNFNVEFETLIPTLALDFDKDLVGGSELNCVQYALLEVWTANYELRSSTDRTISSLTQTVPQNDSQMVSGSDRRL